VITVSNQCPPDPEAIAEAYVMGTLTADEKTAFEDHYLCCEPCATLLQETAAYVDAMRAAAKGLRSDSPKSATTGN
jgi:anti-sigma factor RsiW